MSSSVLDWSPLEWSERERRRVTSSSGLHWTTNLFIFSKSLLVSTLLLIESLFSSVYHILFSLDVLPSYATKKGIDTPALLSHLLDLLTLITGSSYNNMEVPSFATSTDEDEIVQFMLSDFLYNESLNRSIEFTEEDGKKFFTHMVKECVASGTSVVLRDGSGKVIGVRLSKRMIRGEEEEHDENVELTEKTQLITRLLSTLEEGLWDRLPSSTTKVLYLFVLSVSASCARRGFGSLLVNYGIDRVREEGVHGIVSEATSFKSQALFAKEGFHTLHEVRHEDYVDEEGQRIFNCIDGTQSARLVFRPL